MIDELTQEVARTAKLPPTQAALAVKAVLRFLTARLPSRLVGEMHDYLRRSEASKPVPDPLLPSPLSAKNDE